MSIADLNTWVSFHSQWRGTIIVRQWFNLYISQLYISYMYIGWDELFLRNICFLHHLSSDIVVALKSCIWLDEVFSHYPNALSWSAYVFQLQLHFHFIIVIQLQGFFDKQIPEWFSICTCDILQTQYAEIHCKNSDFLWYFEIFEWKHKLCNPRADVH